ECGGVGEGVGILDVPGFTKFEVTGPKARGWLDHMVAGSVPRAGKTALNYFCAPSGGIVTEMTLTNLGEDRFWLISAAAGERHDEHWLREHLPADPGAVHTRNLAAHFGTLIVVGPRARALLARLTPARLDNEAFPWLAQRTVEIGYPRARALRVNYVGELGWELHLPVEHLASVY